MTLDTNTFADKMAKLKARAQHDVDTKDKSGGGNFDLITLPKEYDDKRFRMKHGREQNQIDIIPFEITAPWYKMLKKPSGDLCGLDIGDFDYKLELPVHSNIGPNRQKAVCLNWAFGQPCAPCEERAAEFKRPKDERDADKIKDLKPSWRCFYNVADYANPSAGVIPWMNVSRFLFQVFLIEALEIQEMGVLKFFHPIDGFVIGFLGREKQIGKKNPTKFVEAHTFQFFNRPTPYPLEIVNQTVGFDQYVEILTPDEMEALFLGMPGGAVAGAGAGEPTTQPGPALTPMNGGPDADLNTEPPPAGVVGAALTPVGGSAAAGPGLQPMGTTGPTAMEQPAETAMGTCPNGHQYGVEAGKYDDCFTACEIFQQCGIEKGKQAQSGAAETGGMKRNK